jgi:hypothetical protein
MSSLQKQKEEDEKEAAGHHLNPVEEDLHNASLATTEVVADDNDAAAAAVVQSQRAADLKQDEESHLFQARLSRPLQNSPGFFPAILQSIEDHEMLSAKQIVAHLVDEALETLILGDEQQILNQQIFDTSSTILQLQDLLVLLLCYQILVVVVGFPG